MTTKYLSCADTAKLVRQALKEAFAGVKFSVRSSVYSGGASITIGWTDGPTTKQVESITGQFAGAYFDGMIDYKGSRYAMMDGEQVHFGANFIFTNREHSDQAIIAAFRTVWNRYPGNVRDMAFPEVADFRSGKLWNVAVPHLDSVQHLANIELSKRTYTLTKQSKTAGRTFVTHDDGYSGRYGSGSSVAL